MIDILIATASDIEKLTRVEIESKMLSYSEHLDEIATDPAIRSHRWETYFNKESPAGAKPERIVFKAVKQGKIVGFIAGHLTTRYEKDAEIQTFYVLKNEQRNGIGTMLLDAFLTWLKRRGAKSLCAGIFPENPYQSFYLKYGGMHLNPHWVFWDDLHLPQQRLEAYNKA